MAAEPPEGFGWMRIRDRRKEHSCSPPDISDYRLGDSWVRDWVWRCAFCGKFYKIVEGGEGMYSPMWEWSRCWPWEEWRYQRRFEKGHGH